MAQEQTPRNTEKLNEEEVKNTSGGSLLGGGLLGGDDSSSSIRTGGYVNTSHTDEDGETESNSLDFGSGTLLQSEED